MKNSFKALVVVSFVFSSLLAFAAPADTLKEIIENGCSAVSDYPLTGSAVRQCQENGATLIRTQPNLRPAQFALKLCTPLPAGGFLTDDLRLACLTGVTASSRSLKMRDIAHQCIFAFSDKGEYQCLVAMLSKL